MTSQRFMAHPSGDRATGIVLHKETNAILLQVLLFSRVRGIANLTGSADNLFEQLGSCAHGLCRLTNGFGSPLAKGRRSCANPLRQLLESIDSSRSGEVLGHLRLLGIEDDRDFTLIAVGGVVDARIAEARRLLHFGI